MSTLLLSCSSYSGAHRTYHKSNPPKPEGNNRKGRFLLSVNQLPKWRKRLADIATRPLAPSPLRPPASPFSNLLSPHIFTISPLPQASVIMTAPGSDRPHPPRLTGYLNTEPRLRVNLERLNFMDTTTESRSSHSNSDLGFVELELSGLLSLRTGRLIRAPSRLANESPNKTVRRGSMIRIYRG